MSEVSIIAIDGPASSGKSTLGKLLATHLGYLYFDTGVMYRAVACVAIERGLDVNDEDAVTKLAQKLQIDVRSPSAEDGRDNDLLADGDDITACQGSGVRRHDGHLHRHFCSLTEQSQGVCYDQHRIRA